MNLSDRINIGPRLEELLKEIGINTVEELIEAGSIEAATRIAEIDRAWSSKLYALEGAIQGVRWKELPKDYRDKLRYEFKKNL